MKRMAKIVSVLLAIALLALSFAGCGKGGETPATGDTDTAAAGVIKIGATGPLTGPAAIYGQAAKMGAELAVEEINALGGIQFELKYEDDENDAEKAVNAYNKLKDWGMQVSLGAVTTKPCIALASEVESDRIFALTPSASSTDVIDGSNAMFQMCFTDPNQGVASAQYIKDQALGSKIGIIYNNSDAYSTGIYQKFISEAEAQGLEVVETQTFTDDSANDFSSQLNALKSAGADLLFLPIYYTPASLILSQANKMQYAPKMFGVDGMDGILTVENFDTSLAEGVILLTPFTADAEDEKTQSFVSKYQAKAGEIPNQFAADGYDCIYAIYNAIQKAGITPDMSAADICEKLIETFTASDFSYDGLTGLGVTWQATGEVSKQPKGMVIQNGVYVGMDAVAAAEEAPAEEEASEEEEAAE